MEPEATEGRLETEDKMSSDAEGGQKNGDSQAAPTGLATGEKEGPPPHCDRAPEGPLAFVRRHPGRGWDAQQRPGLPCGGSRP